MYEVFLFQIGQS